MAITSDEKLRAFIALVGPAWAEFTLKQAEALEKTADERGMKFKERDESAPFSSAPEYCANPATGIGTFLHG